MKCKHNFSVEEIFTCCSGALCAFYILHLEVDAQDYIFEAILLYVYQRCWPESLLSFLFDLWVQGLTNLHKMKIQHSSISAQLTNHL